MVWRIFCSFFLFFSFYLFSSSDREKDFQSIIGKIDDLIAMIYAFQEESYQKLKDLSEKFKINQQEQEFILADSLEKKTLESFFSLLTNRKWEQVSDLIDDLQGNKYFPIYQEFVSLFKQFEFLNDLSVNRSDVSLFSESLLRLVEQEKSWLSLFRYVPTRKRNKLFTQFHQFLRKKNFYSWKKYFLERN